MDTWSGCQGPWLCTAVCPRLQKWVRPSYHLQGAHVRVEEEGVPTIKNKQRQKFHDRIANETHHGKILPGKAKEDTTEEEGKPGSRARRDTITFPFACVEKNRWQLLTHIWQIRNG